MMLKIFQAETEQHYEQARELFREYLTWGYGVVHQEYGITLDIDAFIQRVLENMEEFALPEGRLLLAGEVDEAIGCAGLRNLGMGRGEVKRMYVRPIYRGKGVGRALLNALIEEAKQIGYRKLLLDTPDCLHEAQQLYRSIGFVTIAPYPENDSPATLSDFWQFLALDLDDYPYQGR
jgi:GNAT superfamily N-acetyltransferase